MVQRRTKVSHARELYYILFIVMVVALGLFSIWGRGGYLDLKRTQRELEFRKARIEAIENSNRERMRSIQALKSDKRAVEKYAREKGYGKKGEIIQQLPQENTTTR